MIKSKYMDSVFDKINSIRSFKASENHLKIKTIDLHTGGEPLRVILDGFPPLKGNNVLEYRQYAKTHYDHLRTALMHEPRGHADMYGCLLVPPNDDGADFGILFLHNEGYSTMCGHAIIAIAKLAVEMEWVKRQSPITKLRIDAPCGRVEAYVHLEGTKIKEVHFHGVPSFVVELDAEIDVPGIGKLNYDLAYGGAFYAYVNAASLNISLAKENYSQLIEKGMAIKRAIIASTQSIQHPFEQDLSFLYGTIFIDDSSVEGIDSKNVCIFAEGEVDRCPTGSGLSGRLAIHYKRGEINIGEKMSVESITGSVFLGSVLKTVVYDKYDAVIPYISGHAFITGCHEFLINPEDPFQQGFFLR